MKKLKENLFAWMYFLCIFIILIGFAYTTLLFNRAINQVSKNYLLDNNRQLASHISYRLKAGKEFISDFADTLGRMPAFLQTENLLERKAHALELEGIAVFSPKGVTLSSGEIPSLTAWATRHPQIWDRPEVSYIKDVCLIFSAPIVDEDSSKQILVGIQSYQETQSLVSRVYGQHNGVSILFDAGIKAPIMMEKGAETTLTDAEISDILGSLTQTEETLVTTRNGINVSVKPITATDWVQVSIMPANILVDEMNEYITIYLFLVIAGFLFLIVATYRFKKSALKKEQYFLHDPLTTGYNREGFLKESSRLLDGKKLSAYSVVCMNTSNFRYINETWGEDCGNQTLRFIYRILAANLADSELVCRSHVDHFLIMLHKRDEAAVSVWTAESIAQINNMIFKSFGIVAQLSRQKSKIFIMN